MKNEGINCSNSAPATDISMSIHISVPVLMHYASSKFGLDWLRITHTYVKYKVVKLQSITQILLQKILSDRLSIVGNLLEEHRNYSAVAQLLLQAETAMSIYMSLSAMATRHPRLF